MIEIEKYIQGKVVFLGVGNLMRGDDGAGCKFIEELKKAEKLRFSQIYLLDGGQVPENYIEVIAKIKPDKIFIVDSADFGGSPGEVRLIEEVEPGLSFSTHTLSLSFVVDYLRKKTGAKIFILGIQPRKLGWGNGLSSEVRKAVKDLAAKLI
ncbi:hydrogenase maturation peptidase HycI [Candidatus Aerophobetes bacterium]|uniref:Hydrogenase maturation peptidase HycI n=1 Tax=Aerophobetes bacterium TaxID=2030807 RepID=A0A662DHG7_UNCAE|nr:MAG: hydrogenase maturation peptidase HycI [Candidatus Aerophobetes bacterium]